MYASVRMREASAVKSTEDDRRQQGSESNVPFIVVGVGTTPFIGITMVMVSLQNGQGLEVSENTTPKTNRRLYRRKKHNADVHYSANQQLWRSLRKRTKHNGPKLTTRLKTSNATEKTPPPSPTKLPVLGVLSSRPKE